MKNVAKIKLLKRDNHYVEEKGEDGFWFLIFSSFTKRIVISTDII